MVLGKLPFTLLLAKLTTGRAFLQRASSIGVKTVNDLRVGAILDTFSHVCFSQDCSATALTPEDCIERIEKEPPHLLLVESFYDAGDWGDLTTTPKFGKLKKLVSECRRRGIPTVFWNKEDPISFHAFKKAAFLFDHVFTTDIQSIARYRSLRSPFIQSVGVLPFAAQPKIHNPMEIVERRGSEIVFAGTSYSQHEERCRHMASLFDAAIESGHGLVIYNRNTTNPKCVFPAKYQRFIAGSLDYPAIVARQKRHKLALNLNTVTDSPTMFSRRVFELLASGTLVISNPSEGIKRIFGDLVPLVSTKEEARREIEVWLGDDAKRELLLDRATQLIMSEHTYAHRLAVVARSVGIDIPDPAPEKYTLMAEIETRSDLVHLLDTLKNQTHKPVGVFARSRGDWNGDEIRTEFKKEQIDLFLASSGNPETPGFPFPPQEMRTSWMATIDLRARLSADYFKNLALCRLFTEADIITASSTTSPHRHRFVTSFNPKYLFARKELFAAHGWVYHPITAERIQREVVGASTKIYCTGQSDYEVEAGK